MTTNPPEQNDRLNDVLQTIVLYAHAERTRQQAIAAIQAMILEAQISTVSDMDTMECIDTRHLDRAEAYVTNLKAQLSRLNLSREQLKGVQG